MLIYLLFYIICFYYNPLLLIDDHSTLTQASSINSLDSVIKEH